LCDFSGTPAALVGGCCSYRHLRVKLEMKKTSKCDVASSEVAEEAHERRVALNCDPPSTVAVKGYLMSTG
jgi:hypothetical protein